MTADLTEATGCIAWFVAAVAVDEDDDVTLDGYYFFVDFNCRQDIDSSCWTHCTAQCTSTCIYSMTVDTSFALI